MTKPLSGLRVLELARILAGPWAGQILADLGADVIKVERPGAGDDTRGWGPPFVEGPNGENLSAAYYHSCNRGKRSIAVDFETERGRRIVQKLAQRSDILIENFKVGGLAKFGLDYKSLAPENPRLIYCSITGFGQRRPLCAARRLRPDDPGHGRDHEHHRRAVRPDAAWCCVRRRVHRRLFRARDPGGAGAARRTGKGSYIDMALLDTQVGVLANQALFYLSSGNVPQRLGNAHATVVPYQVFPVSDGHIIIACGNDTQFARLPFCSAIPRSRDEPDFKTNAGRVTNRDRLIPRMLPLTQKFTRDDLLKKLEAAGVPGGPINDLADVFADPQVNHRGMRVDLPDPAAKGGTIPGVRSPIMIDGAAMHADRPSPGLGQHTDEILREIGEA